MTKGKFATLRYPTARIEESSDFLEIKVMEYVPPGMGNNESQPMRLGTSTEALQKNQENPLGYIFLPVPQSVKDSNSVDWGDGNSLNSFAAAGVGIAQDAMSAGGPKEILEKLVGGTTSRMESMVNDKDNFADLANSFFASKAVNILGGNTSVAGLMARTSGQVMNPNMELLFKGVQLRKFDFAFSLAPRDETESETIKKMIRIFKINMNSSNSSNDSKSSGLFIKSPNVFQLTYKTGSKSHRYLHKFKPMALVAMGVDYTATGTYATYEDTTPVQMALTLSFKELNPIYAEDYETEEGKIGVGY